MGIQYIGIYRNYIGILENGNYYIIIGDVLGLFQGIFNVLYRGCVGMIFRYCLLTTSKTVSY